MNWGNALKAQKPLHLYKEEAKAKPKHLGQEYMVFEKYDGWYGYYERGSIYSFANRVIPSVQWLATILEEALNKHNVNGRVIFEILLRDETDFHTLNGILNRKYEVAKTAYLMVHDCILSMEEITNEGRYSEAKAVVRLINHESVEIAPLLSTTSDVAEWRLICDSIWARGGEGIIAKQTDAGYKWNGRDATMLKIKCECTFDGLVVGIVAGKSGGKYENTLGAVIIRTKDGVNHTVSGMSDKQRDDWHNDLTLILGKVMECAAMQKLKDGTYREPRYKAIRYDKTPEDID